MRNKKLMERINELTYNSTVSYQKNTDIMVQLAVLRKAFGVKNDESSREIVDYEREIVITSDELTEEFFRYNFDPYQVAKEILTKKKNTNRESSLLLRL